MTQLMTIDEAIECRLMEIEERERGEERKRQEELAKAEANKADFAAALSKFIAHHYGLALEPAELLPSLHCHYDGVNAHMRLCIPLSANEEDPERAPTIEMLYSEIVDSLAGRDYITWVGSYTVMQRDEDGEEGPGTFSHQTDDLIAAIVFAKTGLK